MKLPLLFVTLLAATSAFAGETQPPSVIESSEKSFANDLLASPHLFGDWFGTRTDLEDRGIVFDFNHIADTLGNTTGGRTQTTKYFGRFRATMDIDLEKSISLPGGRLFFTSVYQYGGNLGRDIGTYTLPSSIASEEQIRIDEIFYEQSLFDDKLTVRVGKLAGVNEFGAQDAFVLLNDELAYTPNLNFVTNLPFSPAGQPGVMVKLGSFHGFYVKSGLYSGLRDPYREDPNGLRWEIDDSSLVSAHEIGFKLNGEPGDRGLPGLFRLGGSVNYGDYTETLTGDRVSGNYVLYFMANQMVYRPASARPDESDTDILTGGAPVENIDDNRGLEAGFTIFHAPDDRNPAFLDLTAQLRYTGLIPGRKQDILAAGVVQTFFSKDASTVSQRTGGPELVSETVLELTYQIRAAEWLILQPDAQLFLTPGGNPNSSGALILGFRSVVNF